jgi:hypothetical protein
MKNWTELHLQINTKLAENIKISTSNKNAVSLAKGYILIEDIEKWMK